MSKINHHQISPCIESSTSGPSDDQFSDDVSILQDNQGLHGRKKYGDMCDNYHKIHAKAEKVFTSDPRLLVLLEFFCELYVRRRDMFNEIFPGLLPDDFQDMIKKIRSILLSENSGDPVNNNSNNDINVHNNNNNNNRDGSRRRVLTRSLSVGSRRERSVGVDGLVRPEKFKVKTVVPGGGGGGGGQGGGGGDIVKAGGSNSK